MGSLGQRELTVLPGRGRLDLGLVLTHACNLACVYCYTGEKKRVRMSDAVARRALDLGFDAAGRPGEELQITFFGGEPLLEQSLLFAVAAEARERERSAGGRLLLQMTTNGTLVDTAAARRLADLDVHVALSIDGTRASHDGVRPRAGGGASWDAAIAALACLHDAGRRFDVITVVDPRTVDALADGVRELLDRGVDSLTLNMNWAGGWSDARLATFEQQLEEIAALLVAWLRRGRYVRIQPLESAMLRTTEGDAAGDTCLAGTERLAVAPSGRVYPCPRAVGEDTGRGAIGHVDEGLPSRRSAGPTGRCACANAEETGDPTTAGPVLERHDRAVAAVGRRLSGLLRSEYELVKVVEQQKDNGHAISY